MSKVLVDSSHIKKLANKIRTFSGKSEQIKFSNLASEILSLSPYKTLKILVVKRNDVTFITRVRGTGTINWGDGTVVDASGTKTYTHVYPSSISEGQYCTVTYRIDKSGEILETPYYEGKL